MPHYYGCRIDIKHRDYLWKELKENRLRQGWGFDPGQDLKHMTVDKGAARNRSMLKVKQGDYLLVPRIKSYDTVAIVRATEDFDAGYRYEIPEEGDFGHVFPAEYVAEFHRGSILVGELNRSLRCRSRFWSLDGYAGIIEKLLGASEAERMNDEGYPAKYDTAEDDVFEDSAEEFKEKLYAAMCGKFIDSSWEHALVYGLQRMYPDYEVVRVGGKSEAGHGADIVIKIPSPLLDGRSYVIAIQVKDYVGTVGRAPVDQILKADSYSAWNDDQNKLLEKWVILVKSQEESNPDFAAYAREKNVKVIWSDDFKDLLYEIAMKSKW